MTERSPRIAVLASGRGSNFSAIADACQTGALKADLTCLVTDRPGCLAVEEAGRLKIKVLEIPVGQSSRDEHEEKILEALKGNSPDFLVLAGYRRILGSRLISAFDSGRGYSRIVNIHPSLLPAFPGLDSYRKAFEYGSKVSGVTVHLVTKGVDQGPICAQESFSLEGFETPDQVEAAGLKIEHRLFPKTLQWLLPEKFLIMRSGKDRMRVCQS